MADSKLIGLKKTVANLITNLNQFVYFTFVKLKSCNAADPVSFSHAFCSDTRSIEEADKKAVRFNDVFDVKCVEMYLSKLADVLLSMTETSAIMYRVLQDKQLSAFSLASVLGTHVLSKLAVTRRIFISDGYAAEADDCACGCQTPVAFGDTSFGNNEVWHGSADILLGPVAINVIADISDSDDCSVGDNGTNNGAEEHSVVRRIEESRNQINAQTITFSHAKNYGLVPTITVSKERMKIYSCMIQIVIYFMKVQNCHCLIKRS